MRVKLIENCRCVFLVVFFFLVWFVFDRGRGSGKLLGFVLGDKSS